MTKLNQVYKCELCGNIVELNHTGVGTLVCCEQPMILQEEKIKEEGSEKHLPVVEKLPENVCRGTDGYLVKIGETEHPMTDDHYIEWIEIITQDNKIGRKFLKAGDKPEVEFHTRSEVREFRAYCNVHGLWSIEM